MAFGIFVLLLKFQKEPAALFIKRHQFYGIFQTVFTQTNVDVNRLPTGGWTLRQIVSESWPMEADRQIIWIGIAWLKVSATIRTKRRWLIYRNKAAALQL